MHTKPPTCNQCPLYGDGEGIVYGIYPPGATVKLQGQNPGAHEEAAGVPFVGKTGSWLENQFLPLAGLGLDSCARDNTIRCRWQPPGKRTKTNDLPTGKLLTDAIKHCSQYDLVPDGIRLVVLIGDLALRSQYPDLKLAEWRGHLLPVKE